MSDLYLYSGQCLIGKAGDPSTLKDDAGEALFVGDLVCIYHDNTAPMFAVVADNKFQSYSDGTFIEGLSQPFVMGIKGVHSEPDNGGWGIVKVKSYMDLVDGEGWNKIGFRVGRLNQERANP